MEKPFVARALARAFVFAAWSDGRVSVHERDFLHRALSKMDDLLNEDKEDCLRMLECKPLQSEALSAFRDLRNATTIAADREFALQTMQGLVASDGTITLDEERFMESINHIINGDEAAFYSELFHVIEMLHF